MLLLTLKYKMMMTLMTLFAFANVHNGFKRIQLCYY